MRTIALLKQQVINNIKLLGNRLAEVLVPALPLAHAANPSFALNRMVDGRIPSAVIFNRMADELQMVAPTMAADLRRAALRQ